MSYRIKEVVNKNRKDFIIQKKILGIWVDYWSEVNDGGGLDTLEEAKEYIEWLKYEKQTVIHNVD